MNNHSLGPWSRVLVRLDAVPTSTILASLPKTRKRGLTTPDNTQPAAHSPSSVSRPAKRIRSSGTTASSARLLQATQARPSTTRDPFALLPLHVLAKIVAHLRPLDVLVHQRVSKAWRVILASEYVYTLALRYHFPFAREAECVWALHRDGERFPEAAVEGFRTAAKRGVRRVSGVETVKGGVGMGCWVAADSWLVFDEGLCGRDENRVGVQKLGGGEAGRGWITVGVNRVQDLSVGGGFLRVLLNPGPGDADESDNTTGPWSMRLYDLSDLSLVWQVGVPAHAAVTQNMSDSHTGYIVHDKEATADGAHPRRTIVLHLLSLKTGEATTVLSGIEYRLWGTRASYITPNSEILAVATCDNIRLFSIPSGGTLLSTVPIHQQQQNIPLQPPTTSPPQVHFAFSSVTNTLSIIDDSAAKSWKIRILSATAVELHEAITYGRTDVQATQLFGHHGDCIVLSPSEKGVQIDAVCYDGAVEYARRRVLPPPAGEEEQGAAMEVEVQMEVQPSRCRIPAVGMQLAGAVRDERWVVFKGSNEVANSDGHAAFWVVDFGSD